MLDRNHAFDLEKIAESMAELLRTDSSWNALKQVEDSLYRLMEERPAKTYAVAVSLLQNPLPGEAVGDIERIARTAARKSLQDPPLPTRSEVYVKLARYRQVCGLQLKMFLITGDFAKSTCTGTKWTWYDTRCGVCPVARRTRLGDKNHPASWWAAYWERAVTYAMDYPCEEAFEDGCVWESILQELEMDCPVCYESAVMEYPDFMGELLEVVTEIVDSVRVSFID